MYAHAMILFMLVKDKSIPSLAPMNQFELLVIKKCSSIDKIKVT